MIEVQTGLFLDSKTKFVMGKYVEIRKIISAKGYCFYSKQQKNNIDNWTGEEEKPNLEYFVEAYLGVNDSPDNYVSILVENAI